MSTNMDAKSNMDNNVQWLWLLQWFHNSTESVKLYLIIIIYGWLCHSCRRSSKICSTNESSLF